MGGALFLFKIGRSRRICKLADVFVLYRGNTKPELRAQFHTTTIIILSRLNGDAYHSHEIVWIPAVLVIECKVMQLVTR